MAGSADRELPPQTRGSPPRTRVTGVNPIRKFTMRKNTIKKGTISRDLKPYEGEGDLPKLNPVSIAGVK